MIVGSWKKTHMSNIEKLTCHGDEIKICGSQIYRDCSGEIFAVVEGAIFEDKHKSKFNSALPHILEDLDLEELPCEIVKLDGEYSFAAVVEGKLILARDIIGTRPLYIGEGIFSTQRIGTPLKPGEIFINGKISACERLPENIPVESPAEQLKEALIDAVRKRAEYCGKFGILYSGGIDSAIITRIALELGYKPELYIAGTPNSLDKSRAKEAEELFGLKVHYREVTAGEVAEAAEIVSRITGKSDFLNLSIALPQYFAISEASARGVEFLFTGQGGDELFGGYHRYLSFSPERLQQELIKDLLNLAESNLERDYAVAQHLGVEVFFPYLDRQVVNIALSLPPEKKVHKGVRKIVLREVAELLDLPTEIVTREKKAMQYSSGIAKLLKKLR